MSMGSMEAPIGAGREKDIFSTGWGGTGLELEAIRRKELNATPMRLGDDVDAAAAEAIKYHLERREDVLPLMVLGRILVAHDEMPPEEFDATNLVRAALDFRRALDSLGAGLSEIA